MQVMRSTITLSNVHLDSLPPTPPHLFETHPGECLEGIESLQVLGFFLFSFICWLDRHLKSE